MVQHIYVNMKNTAVRVCLPNGAGYDLPKGHAIQGDHFLGAAEAGVLTPIEGLPPHMRKGLEIHSPLVEVEEPTKSKVVEKKAAAPKPKRPKATGVSSDASKETKTGPRFGFGKKK